VTVSLRERGVVAVVLDIEGTTTPVAFVYDVLFPFARANLRAYLRKQLGADSLRVVLSRLEEEWAADAAQGQSPPPWPAGAADAGERVAGIAAYTEWLMDRDRKSPGLKALQGMIWERGYREGQLRGEVFADVPAALARWRGASIDVAIYSSGSELAQRLIFGHTPFGDLTPYFSRFFDTAVGAKGSSDSYRRIAGALGRPAGEVLFVSDVTTELEAARTAGVQTVLCIRPGNAPQPDHGFVAVRTLDEIGM
jgi:enolase-phosphatase E1